MADDVFLVRAAMTRYGSKVNGFTVFDSLDNALIHFDKLSYSYGGGWVVKPVITAYTFGVPGGRKVPKSERVVAQRRLGLKEI